ncbi:MAG: CHAT domain-containing protein [Bacteroidetes bacterium]|nr:CHAT domain-containing protein [Bacteroidota bacterium]
MLKYIILMQLRTSQIAAIIFLLASLNIQAQDSYDVLKSKYDSLKMDGNLNVALSITKAMKQMEFEQEGDTSLRYAVSFRYIGNCFLDADSSLIYYNLSKQCLEKQNRILHPDYANSLRCELMFAGANLSWIGEQAEMLQKTGDDGILTAAEVSALDLSQTKLVVLSACETGLGKIEGSEGVFGLQRGFKLAGVKQLIVSLWSVPDKETMQLMTTFYSDLAITKDTVKSFAMAQTKMLNNYLDNPEKWAGFVLVR